MKPVTSKSYYEHNCGRVHASAESQLKCFFKEGFSTKKSTYGKKQPARCIFTGSGTWAVVHSADKRREGVTEYTISLFKTFDEAIEDWNQLTSSCNGVDKCQPSCSGMYPEIIAVTLGLPAKTQKNGKTQVMWPSTRKFNSLLPRVKEMIF